MEIVKNRTSLNHPVPEDSIERNQDGDLAMFRFVCEVILSMPIICIGVVANVLAFVALARQKCRQTTSLLLRCLAIVDLLILVSALLLRSIIVLHTYTGTLQDYVAVYPYVFMGLYPLSYVLRLADTLLTTMLTIDRYLAVCRPLQAQRLCTVRRTYRRVALTCVFAVLFSIPRCFEYRVHTGVLLKSPLVHSLAYTLAYRVGLFSLVMYIAPMVILATLNTRLLCVMRRAGRFRAGIRRLSATDSVASPSRSVSVTVVVIVIVCVACNGSALISHGLWSIQMCLKLQQLNKLRRYIAHVSNVMVTVNSAVNFFIYCLCSRSFRRKVSGRGSKMGNHNLGPEAANHLYA